MNSGRKAEIGDRAAITLLIDYLPYATIPRGETGTVVSIDEEGNIEIELDRVFEGLAPLRNRITICAHSGTDDIRDAVLLTAKGKEAKERACKILLQSYSQPQALHSTVSASLLSLLSSMAA